MNKSAIGVPSRSPVGVALPSGKDWGGRKEAHGLLMGVGLKKTAVYVQMLVFRQK